MPLEETTLLPFDFAPIFALYFSAPFSLLFRQPPHICFLPLFMNVPSSPHTSSHMFGHHPATGQLAGRNVPSGPQGLRALRLWQSSRQWRAQPWRLHGCCARVSLAAVLLSQRIDGVARAGSARQAPRAGRARAPWSCSPCWGPSSRTARFRNQLQLPRRRSELGNRRPLYGGQLWSSPAPYSGRDSAICQLPASGRSSWSLRHNGFCADAPFIYLYYIYTFSEHLGDDMNNHTS